MDYILSKEYSKVLESIKPSFTFYKSIRLNKMLYNQNKESKIKNVNSKFSISNKNPDSNPDQKIIPQSGIIDIKDLICKKIQNLKNLEKEEKIKRNKTKKLFGKVEIKDLNTDNFRITSQQLFIKANNSSDLNDKENSTNDQNEECNNSIINRNNNEETDCINNDEILNKFLGSSRLRHTTPIIDNENELRLHLKMGTNNLNDNNKNFKASNLGFKNKTSDHFFMNKQKNRKLNIRMDRDSESNALNNNDNNKDNNINDYYSNFSSSKVNFFRRDRSFSNNLFFNDSKTGFNKLERINLKSNNLLSDFDIKNFNPESQIYFNKQFFGQIYNLYPINLKKDYFIEPSKKLKSVSLGKYKYSIFPNRKNNNSIFNKMKKSDLVEINKKILSNTKYENNKIKNNNFNFMNTEVIDFYDFEGELNNKKVKNTEKYFCCLSKIDPNFKKEKLNYFKNIIREISEQRHNYISEKNDRYKEGKIGLNTRNSFNLKDKEFEEKFRLRMQNMNRDLKCIDNIEIYNKFDNANNEKKKKFKLRKTISIYKRKRESKIRLPLI